MQSAAQCKTRSKPDREQKQGLKRNPWHPRFPIRWPNEQGRAVKPIIRCQNNQRADVIDEMNCKCGAKRSGSCREVRANQPKCCGPDHIGSRGIGIACGVEMDHPEQERRHPHPNNRMGGEGRHMALQISAKHKFLGADLDEQQRQHDG